MKALFFLLGIFLGWSFAHHEVSRECTYQGNFYVGSTVYECKVKE
jgi:hypothetical protein